MDHLLSMEKELERKPFSGAQGKKKAPSRSYLLKFLLGFERLFLSNIVL